MKAVAERILWIVSVFQNSGQKKKTKERHLFLSHNALSVHEALALDCK